MTVPANVLAMVGDSPDLPGAECVGEDPELFFPPAGGGNTWHERAAKVVCRRCPVGAECLSWALAQEVNPYGIWGGTTQRERRAKRAGRPSLVCVVCGKSWPDPGRQGRRPQRCEDCRGGGR